MHSSGKIRVVGQEILLLTSGRVGFGLDNSLSGRVRVVRFSPFGYRVVFGFVEYFVGSG